MAGLGAWAVGALYLGRWSYNHGQSGGSLGVSQVPLYAALLAIAGFLAFNGAIGIRSGRPPRRAMPPGYGLSVVGFGLLMLGAALGALWALTFGRPLLLEELVSPPELLSIAGAILLVSGPLRSVWQRGLDARGVADTWRRSGPAVLSVASALLLLLPFDWMHPAGEAWWMPRPVDAANAAPRNELYVVQADGTKQTRLLVDPVGSLYAPWWSPDGTLIAYQVSPGAVPDDPGDLYIARADGTNPRLVSARSDSPSWSPDQRRLVFESDRDEHDNADIYVGAIDGSGIQRLTTDRAADFVPVWSPDGSAIAFDSDRSGQTQVYVMRTDGSDQHVVIDGPGRSFVGDWSPDGTRIAFASDRDGNFEVYVARADGSEVRQLTRNTASDYDPRWSPDGRRLAFVSFRDGDAELYVVDAAGGEATSLTRNHTMDERAGAAWSPDGSQILFSAHGYPRPELVPAIRADLGVASVIVWSASFAVTALLLAGLGPPLGAFTLVLGIEVALVALVQGHDRFIPVGVAAGLLVDIALLVSRGRLHARLVAILAATLAPAGFLGVYFAAIAAYREFDWSVHLSLGSLALAATIGLFIGWLGTRSSPATSPATPG
jgi:Tol biopolymer transport system component